jgi:hypothetical protein
MQRLRFYLGCLLYAVVALFLVLFGCWVHFGEHTIRKFLHNHFNNSIEVDWDQIPFTPDERERYQA